jgi:hypothetical protein
MPYLLKQFITFIHWHFMFKIREEKVCSGIFMSQENGDVISGNIIKLRNNLVLYTCYRYFQALLK